MSITAETAKAHAKDPAVLCCRAEEGITIEAANLEDPGIFDDLVDSGLLNLEGVLTIEQVLGAKLKKTCDSLTALTPDVVEGYKEVAAEEPVEEKHQRQRKFRQRHRQHLPHRLRFREECSSFTLAKERISIWRFRLESWGEQQLRHLREYLHRSYRQYL